MTGCLGGGCALFCTASEVQVSFCNEFQEKLNFGLSNRFAQVYFALKGVTLGYFAQVDVFSLHSLHGTLEKKR